MNLAVAPRAFEPVAPGREPLATAVLSFTEMMLQAVQWDRLMRRALYANPFHERSLMAAHREHGLLEPGIRFLVARRGDALEASLPFLPSGGLIGWRRAHRLWTSPIFGVNATPLVSSAGADATIEALLDGMSRLGGPPLWILPALSLDSETGRLLMHASQRRGWPVEIISSFERAVLHRPHDGEAYIQRRLSRGRRKGLHRRRRRLEELGALRHVSIAAPDGLKHAVQAFLELEAAGWKGIRGTALTKRPNTRALAHKVFETAEGAVTGRADLLTLNGKPIAVSLAILCAGTAFLLKIAHDERLQKAAPGLVLETAILEAFLANGFAQRLDSASVSGSVLDEFFADRERIADVAIATDPSINAARFATLVGHERRRRAVLSCAKRLYWGLADLRTARPRRHR